MNVVELSCSYWISYTWKIWAHLFLQVKTCYCSQGEGKPCSKLPGELCEKSWLFLCKCKSQNWTIYPKMPFCPRFCFERQCWKGMYFKASVWLGRARYAQTLLAALRHLQFCLTLLFLWQKSQSCWFCCCFGWFVPVLWFCPFYSSLCWNTLILTSILHLLFPLAGINLCICSDPAEPNACSFVGFISSKSRRMFIQLVYAAESMRVWVCK